MNWLGSILSVCLLCWVVPLRGQTFQLHIVTNDSASRRVIQVGTTLHVDALDARQKLLQIKDELVAQGRMACSIDSIYTDSNSMTAEIYAGPLLQWVELRRGDLPIAWEEEMRLNLTSLIGQRVIPIEYQRLIERILTFGENRGYPFVEVGFDSIEFVEQDGIRAKLLVFPNRYFVMDTIQLEGNARISKSFLYSYLGFHPGDPYEEKDMVRMSDRLRKLPFIQPDIQSKVYFSGRKVRVLLTLKERKTDQIDGIIGFAPNPTDNKLLITGEANVDLQNLLKRGLAFDMHWKSFQQRSQQLKLGGSFPYIWQKPVGIDGRFEYVKFDTLFFTIQSSLGVRYMFQGTDFVKFYYQKKSSSLLSIDTSQIRTSGTIPDRNPVDSRSYGAQASLQKLDYVLNPRKGYKFMFNINIGTRKILRDVRIEQVIFRNSQNREYDVYDSIKLTSLQGEVEYALSWFLPLRAKSAVVLSASGQHLLAEKIFFNDLYRFGGTKSLRGFNEESLLANSFTMATLEYRYLFNTTSFFQLFVNSAYIAKQLNGVTQTDTPIGFGTGISLEVRSGLLTLAYALGSEQGNSIRFRDARIHFGIVNYL